MGGSSSSSSSSSTNNQRQVTLDASENEGVAVSAGGNVTVLDGGVIEGSLTFAEEVGSSAFEFGEGVFNAAIDAVSDDRQEQFDNQAQLLSSLAESGRSEGAQVIDKISLYIFIAVVVVGGIYVWKGRK